MHESSNKIMAYFADQYIRSEMSVLDVGSKDINGSYRELFNNYTGLDIEAGNNVDIVVDHYNWDLPDGFFDAIVSGQTFEHIKFFWITLKEMDRVLKPDGLVCIIAPAEYARHRYPVDCWRFFQDGMKAMAEWVDWEILATNTTKYKDRFIYDKSRKKRKQYCDSYLIARKKHG